LGRAAALYASDRSKPPWQADHCGADVPHTRADRSVR
jgi:hypothetical protein